MANTAEDLYELVRQLPAAERLRLVEKIAHDLHATGLPEPAVGRPFEWTQLAGAAPGLLGGDDAQTWVRETRHASDEAREHHIARKP